VATFDGHTQPPQRTTGVSTMIEVEVRLYATLRRYCPELKAGAPLALNLEKGTTVRRLLEDKLGIPTEVVKAVFVNGVAQGPDHVLAKGDRVGIFPPVAGG